MQIERPNVTLIAGVDEVGRGPLVGDVVTAAVILDPANPISGLADFVFIEGNRLPKLTMPAQAVVKGDSLVTEISAASILAKVARDDEMLELDTRYPQYGFAGHKGYPTKTHFAALEQYGAIDEHRKSFKPVQRVLMQAKGEA